MSANVLTPSARSVILVRSAGLWLIPLMLGMKIMQVGTRGAKICASCPAPLACFEQALEALAESMGIG